MKVLVLSNGRGEDVLAVTFLKAFHADRFDCLPLVGDGAAYRQSGLNVVRHWDNLPSRGFLATWRALLHDLGAGLIAQTWQKIRWLQQQVKNYDLVLSFGDLTSVFFLSLTPHPRHYHFETALTVDLRNFYGFEISLLRRHCQKVFVRDALTADFLKNKGVPAVFEGSLMLDDANLQFHENLPELPDNLIILLPSSRSDALANTHYLLELLAPNTWSESFVLALHPDVPRESVQNLMAKTGLRIPIYQGALGNLVPKARAVLGMSGTGCEQMAAMGIPVFLVQTMAAASNTRRMQHYQKVLGPACQILEGSLLQQAQHLKQSLADTALLEKMHQAGPLRFGLPGASTRIARIISRECS